MVLSYTIMIGWGWTWVYLVAVEGVTPVTVDAGDCGSMSECGPPPCGPHVIGAGVAADPPASALAMMASCRACMWR